MLDPTHDNQQGNAQDPARGPRAGAPVSREAFGQMILATGVVLALIVFLIYNVVKAIPQHNTRELWAAIPTTLLLLWLLYKFIRAWVRWRTWPREGDSKARYYAQRRRQVTRGRVSAVWLIAIGWFMYAASWWVAYPNQSASEHWFRMLLGVVPLTLAVLLTLVRRRQLSAANGAPR